MPRPGTHARYSATVHVAATARTENHRKSQCVPRGPGRSDPLRHAPPPLITHQQHARGMAPKHPGRRTSRRSPCPHSRLALHLIYNRIVRRPHGAPRTTTRLTFLAWPTNVTGALTGCP
eukprot:7391924-Prymnesium_polylepis.1